MLENIDLNFILAVVIAYLLGSISPSTILAKAQGVDIKKEGSGNAGTTNTLRVLGKKAAIITLIVDIGKGVLAVSLAEMISGPEAAYVAALAALCGHVWPIFFKFKGGKGVATAFGVVLRLDWRIAVMMFALLVVVVLITKMVSVGSISVCIAFPIACWFMHREMFPVSLIMAAIVIWKHSDNIKRLINHDENEVDIGKLLHGKK
ncbi:MAG: glycerol-3-phosphate 1-O-acyltransferase PlsY [Eubacterium sp.]|nr:glycerol-3-phosphate 1-O-acyltransferase PlsY [Eubacterium sp.]